MRIDAQMASWSLAASAAAACTTATFSKSFVPFYMIGSTPIFVATCLVGLILIALDWRRLIGNLAYVRDILIILGVLYAIVVASFLVNSLHRVPVTYLVGIFLFHGLFLLFGFAAARALKAVFATLLVQAAVYAIVVAQYTA